MTEVIEGVNVLTYQEWEKLPGVKELLGDVEDCDGTGEHECSCGDVHDCRSCDGSGKDGGVNIRGIYEETLRDEIKKLIAWRDGLAIKHPSNMGDKHSEPVSIVAFNIHGNAG